jgi:ABC-type transporter Mla subunit MlaD
MSPVDEDNLDGVTREELVRAQIAKHKEILQPDTPIVTRMKAIDGTLATLNSALRDVREVLHDILMELQHHRNQLQPPVAKVGEPKKFTETKT